LTLNRPDGFWQIARQRENAMSDCLLVHVPKFQNRYRPLGNYTSTQWMALGIFALADAVRSAGCSVRILHAGLERMLDPRFTLASYLRAHPTPVVAFSIHFHQQLHDSLAAARRLKAALPDVFIVAGGLSATYFAEDMLRQFPAVDAVVAGEGERALAQLVAAIRQGRRDLSDVPNLLWRREGQIVRNAATYVASAEDLDALNFTDLSLLEHHDRFVEMPKIATRLRLPPALRWKVSRVLSQKKRRIYHALPVGRGCTVNCCYCGGGVAAHRQLNHRIGALFRSPTRVLESMRQLKSFGYHGAYVSFDPRPRSDAYYQALFRLIREERIAFDLPFSAWAVPSREFIEQYAQTFTPHSWIAISPETGSEELRRKVRGVYFSNDELLEALRTAERVGVRTEVFFSLGLPFETRKDFEETLRLRDRIAREFRHADASAFAVEAEPAAPWCLDPERYGIHLVRRTLSDFLTEQASPNYSSMSSLGYWRDLYLDEPVTDAADYARRVLATKCRHFCDQRAACAAMSAFWATAEALRLSSSGETEV
jgi:radical SAM superfamily enzyme YgiQ (UPF0313 family)